MLCELILTKFHKDGFQQALRAASEPVRRGSGIDKGTIDKGDSPFGYEARGRLSPPK